MPITFVDGSSAEFLFRRNVRPNQLGAYGHIAGGLGAPDRSVYFRYGDGSEFMYRGPLESYAARGGTIAEVWEPPPDGFACPNLVFRFDDWFVGVRTCQDELTEEEKAEWARRLVGRQTGDGFLVLEAIPPLEIAGTGEHEGTQLWLQGSEPIRTGWRFITLTPGPCRGLDEPATNQEIRVMPDGQRASFTRIGKTWYADWCEDRMMYIQVESSDKDYVEAVAKGLRVRNVRLAGS